MAESTAKLGGLLSLIGIVDDRNHTGAQHQRLQRAAWSEANDACCPIGNTLALSHDQQAHLAAQALSGIGGFVGGGGNAGPCDIENNASFPRRQLGDTPPIIGGLYAGIGAGAFWTNADSAADLKGYFSTINVNTPWVSFQLAMSGLTVFASLTAGYGGLFSFSIYPTTGLAE